MAAGTAAEANLEQRVAEGTLEFDDWIALLSDVEKRYADNIDKLSFTYEAFLSEYPLCYGYWRKYAKHKAHLCTLEEVVEVFERSVESAAYSVDVWVGYCTFGISCFEDPLDVSSFKKLVATWRADLGSEQVTVDFGFEAQFTDEVIARNADEIGCIIDKLLNPSTRAEGLAKYSSIGEQLYHRISKLDAEICEFEKNIHRPYFDMKPLDDRQLDNWHKYLDFGERKGDFDWAVKLYERCLIPCANYPEFWMRYVEFVEAKGGREIANDALGRATHVFLKWFSAIHLINAGFKEQIGEFDEARAAFDHLDRGVGFYSVESVLRRANMEKRMGNYVEASNIFKEAVKVAADRKLETLPVLYVQFSRLEYAMTNNVVATRDILLDGIYDVPCCKLLLEELIKFAMTHEGAQMVNAVESFIDLHGTIRESRRAWFRHMKSFPHLLRSASSKQPTRAAPVQNIAAVGDPVDNATHLMELPTQVDNLLLTSNLDHPEEADGSLNLPEQAPLVASKPTIDAPDACDDETAQLSPYVDIVGDDEFLTFDATFEHQASKENQEVESLKLDTLSLNHEADNPPRSPALKPKGLQDSTLSDTHVPGYNSKTEAVPSLSSPLRIQVNMSSERLSLSPVPTPINPSPVSTPDSSQFDWPSDRGSNQNRHSYTGRHIPATGSSGLLKDQVDDKWPRSPRRQGSFEQSDGWRHDEWLVSPAQPSFHHDGYKKQSVSPRRYASRRRSEDRYHSPSSRSPRRQSSSTDFDSKSSVGQPHQRQPRYRDGSRNQRGGQRRNMRQMQNMQNQSAGFATQGNVQGQPGSFPQAQMSMYPMQGNGQYPFAQNPQAYAQMWQFYYYQQQQLAMQQLAMQQQQPYLQAQQIQMQPHQQQQFVQLQYQQQLQMQQQQQQGLSQQPQQQTQADTLQQQQQSYQQPQLVPQQQSDQQMPTQQLQQPQLLQQQQQQYYNQQQQPQLYQQQQQQPQQYTLTQEQLQQLYEQLQRLPQQQHAGQQTSTQQAQLLQQQAGQRASTQEQQQKQQQEQQLHYQQFQQQCALYLQHQQFFQKQSQQQQQSPHDRQGLSQEQQSSQLKNVSPLSQKEQPKDEAVHQGHEGLSQHQPSELQRQWHINERLEQEEDDTSELQVLNWMCQVSLSAVRPADPTKKVVTAVL
ncbi:Pre-mRNA-processing factor 39-2-like protein [Drosera capensis]